MKKWIAFALCAVMALTLIACTNTSNDTSDGQDHTEENQTENQTEESQQPEEGDADSGEGESEENVEIANPFTEYATVAEAAEAAGVTFTEPTSLPEGYTFSAARAIAGELMEVVYTNGENDLTIRKAIGTEDCSGDTTVYSETSTQTVDEMEITCKGEDGMIMLATWTDGESSYAVSAAGEGLDQNTLTTLVGEIMG